MLFSQIGSNFDKWTPRFENAVICLDSVGYAIMNQIMGGGINLLAGHPEKNKTDPSELRLRHYSGGRTLVCVDDGRWTELVYIHFPLVEPGEPETAVFVLGHEGNPDDPRSYVKINLECVSLVVDPESDQEET